jgi:predicted amidohydrolase YtcJ
LNRRPACGIKWSADSRTAPWPSYNLAVLPSTPSAAKGNLLVRGARRADWQATAVGVLDHLPPGDRTDVRIRTGRIVALAPALDPEAGEEVLEAPDTVVLPGLHDHHLHLRSLVAATRSAAVGPAEVGGRSELAAALRRAPVDRHGWRRAVGYHESVAGELDRSLLDALLPGAPVRVQHRSGVFWALNSAGLDALGLDALGVPGVERDERGLVTGRLFRMDEWLAGRLPDDDPVKEIAAVSRRLAATGVVGVTDATPHATAPGVAALVEAVAAGALRQRLHVMCAPDVEVGCHPLVSRGPQKVMLDDDRLPALEDVVELVRAWHRSGAPVAVHCVTVVQLAFTLAVFAAAGSAPGDRIEHGSVVPAEFVGPLAAMGLTVVTNPGLVYERGETYLQEVDERDLPFLYPCASLVAAGVTVAAGTDAPFGPEDPWTSVRTARTRRARRGDVVGAHEAVPLPSALALFSGYASDPGRVRRVALGEPGDLCFLADGDLPGPGQPDTVVATVVAGSVVHRVG